MQRYILTGAPGAGKTTILAALRERGYAVVEEAATDLIANAQALGHDEPWSGTGFLDAITLLQRERQQQPVPPATAVQVFDRSPLCTLALAHYSDLPVPPSLANEVDRVIAEEIFEPRVSSYACSDSSHRPPYAESPSRSRSGSSASTKRCLRRPIAWRDSSSRGSWWQSAALATLCHQDPRGARPREATTSLRVIRSSLSAA